MTAPVRRPARPVALALLAAVACGGARPGDDEPAYTPPDVEPPVAINAVSPFQYPPELFDRGVEGDVVLRLFVDSAGHLVPESTRVADPSGYPALDSAAVRGAGALRYAPARRRGIPVATVFLQAVEFRHPTGATPRGQP